MRHAVSISEAAERSETASEGRGQAAPGPRLAYLVSRYPAISHTFILREVRELRRRGFAVQVASVNAADRPLRELTAEEGEEADQTFYVKRAGLKGALASHAVFCALHPWAYARALLYAVAQGGFDVRLVAKHCLYLVEAVMIVRWMSAHGLKHLHVHFATPASTVALLAAYLAPIGLSMTVHGPDEFDEVGKYLVRQKIGGCRWIATISCYTRSQLLKLADVTEWPKISVIPLGVDTGQFAPWCGAPGASAGEKETGVFEVLCVGRLVPAKGQHVLLAALERLLGAGRRVHLTLAGDGPDRAGLERRVRERGLSASVEFAGAVNQDGIRALYRRADAFALASFAEGLPIVLMEAMAMAIPCVATWVAGIPELIRDHTDGLLVAPSDDQALAAALARLMDDDALRARLGEAGRRRILDKYDLQRNVAQLARMFDQCCEVAA